MTIGWNWTKNINKLLWNNGLQLGENDTGKCCWWFQLFAVFSVSSSCISCGNFLGYTSSAIPSMQKDSLTFPIFSPQTISLIGGLGPLGALLGSLLTLIPFRWLGPRRTIGIFGIPAMFGSWLMIGFCNNNHINFLFAARFLGGIGCGFIISCAPLYVIDISSIVRRGQLGIMPQFLMILGILISYIFGSFLRWNYLARACALILVPSGLIILVAPDPPGWLVSRGQPEKALKVLEKLNGSKLAGEMLEEIQTRFQNQGLNSSASRWNLGTLKAVLISLGIISVQQLTGINGVTFFALSIFNKSIISQEITGNIPSIVLASTQLIASFMSTLFVEEFGRKCLLTISTLIISLTGLLLGLYFYFYTQFPLLEDYHWIPLVTLVIFAFGFAIGLGPVTWILVTEILPQETRHLMNPIVIAYNWLCVFIVTSSFPLLREEINYYGIFWLYACIAFVGVIFIMILVPETKGKTQVEIQAFFKT